MPDTVIDLGKAVKAKYAGAYDDLSDEELGRSVKAKYPGAYDDFADVTTATPQTPQKPASQPAKQPAAPKPAATAQRPFIGPPVSARGAKPETPAARPSPFPNAQAPMGLPSPEAVDAATTRNAQVIETLRSQLEANPPGVPLRFPNPQPVAPLSGVFNQPFAQKAADVFAGPGTLAGQLMESSPGQGVYPDTLMSRLSGLGGVSRIGGLLDAPPANLSALQLENAVPGTGTASKIGRGVAKGVEAGVTGFISPKNIGLMIGTFGASGIPALNALISGGFAIDSIYGAAKQYPQLREQIARGDVEGAAETLTSMGISATMGTLAGAHATKPVRERVKAGKARRAQAEAQGTNTAGLRPGDRFVKEAPPPAQPARSAVRAEPTPPMFAKPKPKAEAPAPEPQAEEGVKEWTGPLSALAHYEALFDEADHAMKAKAEREAELAKKRPKGERPTVPATGVPENVARVVDARERLAKQLTGKAWADTDNSERLTIDEMIREGYGHAVPDRASFEGEKRAVTPAQPTAEKETKPNAEQTQIRTEPAAAEPAADAGRGINEQPERGGERAPAEAPARAERPESAAAPVAPTTAVEPAATGRRRSWSDEETRELAERLARDTEAAQSAIDKDPQSAGPHIEKLRGTVAEVTSRVVDGGPMRGSANSLLAKHFGTARWLTEDFAPPAAETKTPEAPKPETPAAGPAPEKPEAKAARKRAQAKASKELDERPPADPVEWAKLHAQTNPVGTSTQALMTHFPDLTYEEAKRIERQVNEGETPPAAPAETKTPATETKTPAGETPKRRREATVRKLIDQAKRLQAEAADATGAKRTKLLATAAKSLDEADKLNKLDDADAALERAKTKTTPAQETGPHGPVLRNFRHDAAGAIAELRRLESGDAIGALHHPDPRLGDTDLIWGEPGTPERDFEDGYGIAKLVAKGREDLLRDLPEFFPKMRVDEARSGPNRIRLVDDKRHAAVRLDYDGATKHWLLTAYEDTPTSERRTSVSGNPKAGGTPPPIGAGKNPSAARTIDVRNAHATERQTPPSGGSGSSVAPGYPERATPAAPQGGAVTSEGGGKPTGAKDRDRPPGTDGGGTGRQSPIPQKAEAGRRVRGKATTVAVPGTGKRYRAHYEVRPLADIQPSHSGLNFLPNDRYEHKNDRNYDDPRNRDKVVLWSGKGDEGYDPANMINTAPDAGSGPPIIDEPANALGGNGRTMIQQRVAAYNPEGLAAYRKLLDAEAAHFGIDPASYADMENPFLVRVIDDADLPDADAVQNAISDFNVSGTAALTPAEQAMTDSRRVSQETLDDVGRRIEQMDDDDATLAQVLEGRAGLQVLNNLISDGVIPRQERAKLATEDKLTRQGAERIGMLLIGRFFANARQLDAMPDIVRSKMERVAATLARIDKYPGEYSLTPLLRDAFALIEDAVAHEGWSTKKGRDTPWDKYIRQGSLGGQEWPPDVVRLVEALRTLRPTAIAEGLGLYAKDAQYASEYEGPGMFGGYIPEPVPPAEALEKAMAKMEEPPKAKKKAEEEPPPLFGGPATTEFMGFQTLATGIAKAAKAFGEKDVLPTLRETAAGVRDFVSDAMTLVAPTLRSKAGQKGSLIFRARLAELARASDQARYALRDAIRHFDKQKASENYDFIDRMEKGLPQKTAELDAIASTLRKLLDERRDAVRALGKGKLRKFYENYFPHIWKDKRRAEAIFKAFFGKRPLEGSKSFLKQRTLPTFADGLNRGLEPLSDNPVDLTLAKLYEMDRYLMAHRVMADWKAAGLARFVDARKGKAPKGWKRIENDSVGTVYGPSVQPIPEWLNEGLVNSLADVSKALGITHKRGFLNLGQAIGRAYSGGARIETLHGSPEDTIAHEIGHQIDWLAGSGKRFVLEYPDPQTVARLKRAYKTLKDKGSTKADRTAARKELKALAPQIAARKQFAQELRDLADLRKGGTQAYRRSREEKMAQLAQMWVGARPLFERTAPTVFKEWKAFLDENPKLHALRDAEATANPKQLASLYDVGGLVIRGHYYAPEGAALIMNNYLSPGLRRFAAYRAIAGLNNGLNIAQLGLSGFHLGFVSADAAVSKAALAFQALLKGQPITAAKMFAETPLAPVTSYLRGRKGIAEWRSPGTQGTRMEALVKGLERAGGRVSNDPVYQTNLRRNMMAAWRQGNVLGAALRAPFALAEVPGAIILNHIVPAMKVGAALDLMRFHLERMDPQASAEDVSRVLAQDWNSIENRLGEMTYDNLFWNRTAKDLAMIAVRSVGWNLGTLREIGGGIGDIVAQPRNALKGKPVNMNRLSYLAGLVTVTATMNAVYQYLHTGKPPDEPEDYFFPKNGATDEQGRPQRSSPPTYIKDVYHYGTHPMKTLANKLAPVWSAVDEMIRNKDFYGNKIRNADDPLVSQLADIAKHAAKTAIPIGVRNYQRETALASSPATRAEQFIGMSPAPAELDKTPAERLAAELTAERSGDEPGRPADAAERRDLRLGLARALRGGKAIPKETLDAIRSGKLTTRDLKLAYTQAHESPLEGAFSRLTIADALKVYRAATADERLKLRGMLLKKGQAALKSEPPAARVKTLAGLRDALTVQ